MNPPPPTPPLKLPASRGRVSLLAIAGIILSVVACCPPVSLLGSVLGVLALQRIAAAGPTLRGKRIAKTAAILGLCFSLAGFVTWWRVSVAMETWTHGTATSLAQDFVNAAQAGDLPSVRRLWADDVASRTDDAEFSSFGKAANDRFGVLRTFNPTSITTENGMFAALLEMAGTFTFESGERPGAITVVLVPSTGFSMPRMRLKSITIDDAQRGDLALPAPVAESTASQPGVR